jgi:hypothetical protein
MIIRVLRVPVFQCPDCIALYEKRVKGSLPLTSESKIQLHHPPGTNCQYAGRTFVMDAPEFIRLDVHEVLDKS